MTNREVDFKENLRIQDYEVWVRLGCTSEEQTFLQPVHLSAEVNWDVNLAGSKTDKLGDAVDYVVICQIIKKIGESKSFYLIEHLGREVAIGIYDFLLAKSVVGTLSVSARKLRVPVANLREGVVFSCSTKLS